MSYRFTNTEKWHSDSWFIDLKAMEKLLFIYLCENCDIAGFIEYSVRRFSFDLNTDESTIEGAMKGLQRGLMWSENGKIIYLRNFIKHQKNLPLTPEKNPSHRGIFERLNSNLNSFGFNDINQFTEGANKGLNSPIGKGKGKGKGKEEGVQGGEQFKKPSLDEVKKFFQEKGYSEKSAITAFEYYEAGGWVDGHGKKVRNWKQKMIAVWFSDANKVKTAIIPTAREVYEKNNQYDY